MVVIQFMGGLGNQMYQYSFYKQFIEKGKVVKGDFSWFSQTQNASCSLALFDAFESVEIDSDDADAIVQRYKREFASTNYVVRVRRKLFPYKYRRWISENVVVTDFESYYKYENCYLSGYWANKFFWVDRETKLKQIFQFNKTYDMALKGIIEQVSKKNTVSIHIRRGDYLLEENSKIWGGLCTVAYYQAAIEYFRKNKEEVSFFIFTNDMEWAKERFKSNDIYFVNDYYENDVPDWCDMYLMSLCNHNIIANSTFSWWAATLNDHANKLVVAPAKWHNDRESDMYWDSWIKIDKEGSLV